MLTSRTNIHYFLVFLYLFSGCAKNDTQAQNKYKGKQKHAPVPSASLSLDHIDYKTNTPLSGKLKDSLDKTVKELFDLTGMPGLSVAILVPGQGIWQTDTGYRSKLDQKRVDSATTFYWASVSKLITATIIDQLVSENKLSYQDKLSQWYPQFDQANRITIGQLLTHTSGLASFNTDPGLFSLTRHYTPQELIEIALKQKNLFPPGTFWSYSNTGYLLLALIAEKIEQRNFAELVQQRIASPLHLHSLRVLSDTNLPDNLALAHDSNGQIVAEDYTVPLGAGNIAGKAGDLVSVLYGLLSDKLTDITTVYDRLQDLYPMFDEGQYYGRGMMVTDFSGITQTKDLWIGHSGGTETYRALLIYDVSTKIFLAISVNAHISVEAVARKLIETIKKES